MNKVFESIRNVAIIAHVDHGKTTLIDVLLRQMEVQRNIGSLGERIMDSMDLEKERGITIRSKNTSVFFENIKINIVDTPGHADFGGEVERVLRMVDGALLIVDVKEGPMPQTRFVLSRALSLNLRIIVVLNKIDQDVTHIDETLNKVFDLFCDLNASDAQLDFPVLYASAVNGIAMDDMDKPSDNIFPLLRKIVQEIPQANVQDEDDSLLQILILSIMKDPYKGKIGIGKITKGNIVLNSNVVLYTKDKQMISGKITCIFVQEGLNLQEVPSASVGEIVGLAGFENIGIGDSITKKENPIPLEPPDIEKPTIRMIFGVNTSPFAGREGKYLTSRMIRERLIKELETNVSLRMHDTDMADQFIVEGRGELHLSILVEQMRREGYELEVSSPEVVYSEIDGKKCEPFEFLTIDVPSNYQGTVIEIVSKRKSVLKNLIPSKGNQMHFEYVIPTRGMIGLRNVLITATRGTAVINNVFDCYKPKLDGEILSKVHGSLIVMEDGVTTGYSLNNIQERGELFVSAGLDVYAGMIIGENAKSEDLVVSPCKSKKLTNMRASGSDDAIMLSPPKIITLESAIEYISTDEFVELTPQSIRLRKKVLNHSQRKKKKR